MAIMTAARLDPFADEFDETRVMILPLIVDNPTPGVPMAGCYLIHFDEPYKHAQHYLGYSVNIEARIEQHKAGQGARLMEVIKKAGIGCRLARVWPNADRALERRLKNQKNASHLCPICKEAARK